MAKKRSANYPIGDKKPRRGSQFKPGRSGNPHGRPKQADTVADVLQKELKARIAVVKDGKRQMVSMLRAIIKQHLNMAAKGDSKAFDNLLKALKVHRIESGDNLSALVQEFRAIHEQHVAADHERVKLSDVGDLNGQTESHSQVSLVKEKRENL